MAKAIVTSIDEVPEALRGEYVAQDGVYVLKIDGGDQHPATLAAHKAAEARFRDRNIAQAKELDDAKKRLDTYAGVDPAEYASLKRKVTDFEQQLGAKDPAGVLALVQKQVADALGPVEAKLKASEEREAQKAAALAKKNVESALRDAAVKAGVADEALPDFLNRGVNFFSYEEGEDGDGRVIAKAKDGSPVFSKRSAGQPMSTEEWAFGLSDTAPHLFRPSSGGGAPGGAAAGTDSRGNRWVNGADPMEFGKNLEAIASGKMKVAGR